MPRWKSTWRSFRRCVLYALSRASSHPGARRRLLHAIAPNERADEPTKLTDDQQTRIDERDKLYTRFQDSLGAGKFPEAIADAEKMLQIERDVLGSGHHETFATLQSLMRLKSETKRYGGASPIAMAYDPDNPRPFNYDLSSR